jgi:acetaldehyde dehydrogenase
MSKAKVGIIGSGNIGTDLMFKIMRLSNTVEVAALVGLDPESDGLRRAQRLGVAVTSDGIKGLVCMPEFKDISIVFDATSAGAHKRHDEVLRQHGKQVIDLTPAAIGPFTIPAVNLDANLESPNVNMVTCGGQATIPIVAAINRMAPVLYAEIVASIASKSAGPGTRANIDEFTETTARAVELVGGARQGKAIIVLNPADPPLIMRDTVYCLCEDGDEEAITSAVLAMVETVRAYVPGYRLKQQVQCVRVGDKASIYLPSIGRVRSGLKITVFLEVEGAAHYLPAYAGNLDIMTSAALRTAERTVELRRSAVAA